ncbi:hypothetical protein C8Q74DRAFT_1300288 [Fomes fomentarius]|nr:hypothetical protein C8Q74DRAFT_1300288 [Fomes fomentarius]
MRARCARCCFFVLSLIPHPDRILLILLVRHRHPDPLPLSPRHYTPPRRNPDQLAPASLTPESSIVTTNPPRCAVPLPVLFLQLDSAFC